MLSYRRSYTLGEQRCALKFCLVPGVSTISFSPYPISFSPTSGRAYQRSMVTTLLRLVLHYFFNYWDANAALR